MERILECQGRADDPHPVGMGRGYVAISENDVMLPSGPGWCPMPLMGAVIGVGRGGSAIRN